MTKPRIAIAAILSIAIAHPILLAQAGSAKALAFDVATIKPVAPDARPTHGWIGLRNGPDGMEASWLTLPDLMCSAFGYGSLRFDGQIAGAPGWALTQKYDIVAKMSDADSAEFQKLGKDEQEKWREAMLQSLLAERFHLTVHRASKQVPVYDMVVAKGGSKVRDAATDPTPPQLGKDGKPTRGIHWLKDTSTVQDYSMSSFADLLSLPAAQVGRPVVDKTGLTGTYNFTLDWSIYSATDAANGDANSIFTALEKIGLKLQPSTSDMKTVVIDHVDPASAN